MNELDEIQTVEQHCLNTAQIAATIGEEIGIRNLAYLSGVLHDLGKETAAFSTYIREQHLGISKQKRGDINHSTAGAKYLNDIIQPENVLQRLTIQLLSYSITAHHGLFDIVSEEGEDCYNKRLHPEKEIYYEEAVNNYLVYMNEDSILQLFTLAVVEVANVNQKIGTLLKKASCAKCAQDKILSIGQFALGAFQRLLLSIVIDADRIDTNNFMTIHRIDETCDTQTLWKNYRENLENYIRELPTEGRIAVLRGKISSECLEFSKNSTGIYRLSCPTGGGKTLASFRYALAHAEKFNKKHIIYIAPYRAILEQNCEVIRKALRDVEHILEHHSDVIPDDNERYQYLTERYQNPIIFTTMVQFLNTLFAHQTQSIRRFHSFSNSILIVDEVQSIPVKCIHMFNQMMNFLATCCDTTVILCTATQPALEKVEYPIIFTQPIEMIKNLPNKYTVFKRVNIVDARRKSPYDGAQLRQLIMMKLEQLTSILVILNTKDAAKKCYEECKEYLQSSGDNQVLLYHLSTNMCPQHRIDRLNELKANLDRRKVICISTQLIEAGVDISFQCVIRSFAGLDSIAQAAGRCNRHGQKDCEEVLIVNYNEENLGKLVEIKQGQEATGLILDTYVTQPELFDGDLLSVKAMDKFYERYYFGRLGEMNYSVKKWNTSIFDMLSTNKKGYMESRNKAIKQEYVLNQAFDTAAKEFEVIDSKTTGIIVPYGQGIELINEFNSTQSKKDLSRQFKLAQRYTVNLYQHVLHRLEEEGAIYELMIGGIYALKDGFYNEVTGLQLEGYFECLIQ